MEGLKALGVLGHHDVEVAFYCAGKLGGEKGAAHVHHVAGAHGNEVVLGRGKRGVEPRHGSAHVEQVAHHVNLGGLRHLLEETQIVLAISGNENLIGHLVHTLDKPAQKRPAAKRYRRLRAAHAAGLAARLDCNGERRQRFLRLERHRRPPQKTARHRPGQPRPPGWQNRPRPSRNQAWPRCAPKRPPPACR